MMVSLDALYDADRPLLLKAWSETMDIDPPTSISQDMMRLIISWRIQAAQSPGAMRPLLRQMDQHFASDGLASEKRASPVSPSLEAGFHPAPNSYASGEVRPIP